MNRKHVAMVFEPCSNEVRVGLGRPYLLATQYPDGVVKVSRHYWTWRDTAEDYLHDVPVVRMEEFQTQFGGV